MNNSPRSIAIRSELAAAERCRRLDPWRTMLVVIMKVGLIACACPIFGKWADQQSLEPAATDLIGTLVKSLASAP